MVEAALTSADCHLESVETAPCDNQTTAASDDLDPDVLLAAVIEAVAENLPNWEAEVMPLSHAAITPATASGLLGSERHFWLPAITIGIDQTPHQLDLET